MSAATRYYYRNIVQSIDDTQFVFQGAGGGREVQDAEPGMGRDARGRVKPHVLRSRGVVGYDSVAFVGLPRDRARAGLRQAR